MAAHTVLAVFAHPDDAEFLCAGTLAILAGHGANIHIATLTPGDCGSTTVPAKRIASIRRKEARRAARLIDAAYTCLEEKDLCIFYDRRTLGKVMELVRRVSPTLVFTHSPADYMVDHETTSRLAQTACFGAMAPNFQTGRTSKSKPLRNVPYLYYTEPFGGRDILGNEIRSNVFVDITSTFSLKERMVECHKSQQTWLRAQQGISDNLAVVRRMAEHGRRISEFQRSEGFRPHLGQGFPQNNILADLLGGLVRTEPRITELRFE